MPATGLSYELSRSHGPATRAAPAGMTHRMAPDRSDTAPRQDTPQVRETLPEMRPPYKEATLAGLLVFALYAVTLSRTTAFWDTSEYIATAHILGIPHPPGNPLFVVLARAWSVLLAPFGLPVSVRVNLFSAFMSAASHGLWFLVIHHILRYFSEDRRFRLIGAAAAVLVSATAFTVWNQSNVNEKVYTVSLLTIALLSWLAFLWQENLGKGKDDNLLILMAFILALSVGNHLMAFLAAPAIGIFILLVHPQTLLNWRLYIAGAIAAVLGLSIHLFLPIRAGLHPIINEAAPTCPDISSALGAIITYGKAGCAELSDALNRTQYDKPPLLPRLAPLHAQIANYLQYFDWQWSRALDGTNTRFATLRIPFTMLFTGFGIWGLLEHFRRDRLSFAYLSTLFLTVSAGLVWYMNFEYGFSLVPEGATSEVRERDYFFIVSFSVWGLWAGIGITTLWRDAAHELRTTLAKASPVLALAFIPLFANWTWASRADDYAARDWAYNLLMSVEPYGVLFTNGDNDTFPLWYLQEVEGIRRDVTVMVTSYLNTPWYAIQLKGLTEPCPEGVDPLDRPTLIVCQRPYTAENTGAAYVGPGEQAPEGKVALRLQNEIRRPTKGLLPMDEATIRQIAGRYARIGEGRALLLGNVVATPPSELLAPWHQYALTLINHVIDERPIYFASSGNAATALGVDRYLVRHGLAFKLNTGELPESAPPGVVRMEPSPYESVIGDWVAVERTRQLAEDVFVHSTGIPDDWTHWPDQSTIGIPNYYMWTYLALAQAAVQAGDQEALDRYQERAQAWSRLGSVNP